MARLRLVKYLQSSFIDLVVI